MSPYHLVSSLVQRILFIALLCSLMSADLYAAKEMSADKVYPRFAVGVTGVYATIENLEVVVSDLATGSPAAASGLVNGDVLTSVNGNTLAVPDPRIPLGEAINAAEGAAGVLTFGVDGKADVVITIPVLGSYVTAWPAGSCPKSAQIVDDLAAFITARQELDGSYNFDGSSISTDIGACLTSLFLLSTGDDALLPNVQLHVQTIAPAIAANPTTGNWHLGYQGMLFAEYYLRTGDVTVLPALQAICDRAIEQQLNGGWGHGNSGSPGYVQSGLMNSAGLPVLTTLILARECGVTVADAPYQKALKLMYRMVGHGCVPYGNHRSELGWSSTNGRNAKLACAFSLLEDSAAANGPQYKSAAEHLALLVTDSYHQHEFGHTGGGFNVMWRGLGSAHVAADKDANRQRQMNTLAWYYDLCRQPGGGFSILPTPPDTDRYSVYGLNWGCGAFGLTYTAPRKALRITGGAKTAFSVSDTPPAFEWGIAADRTFLSTDHAAGFGTEDDPDVVYDWLLGDNKATVTVAYCEKHLKHYSPMVRWWASERLRAINTTESKAALASAASHADPRVRRSVYDALSGYNNWSRSFSPTVSSAEVSSTFLSSIVATLENPNSAWWEIDGALFALGQAEPADIRANLATIDQFALSDEWQIRESAFWAVVGLGDTITGPEFDKLSQAYKRADAVFERHSCESGFRLVLNSGHQAFDFGQRAKSVRVLGETMVSAPNGYEEWNLDEYQERYFHETAHRAMMLLDDYDPAVYRFIVEDIASYLKEWEPGYQHGDWLISGNKWQLGFVVVLRDHLGAYGRPVVEEFKTILAKYDDFSAGTVEQKAEIQAAVDSWEALYDPYASPILADARASLTAFYDFEGDFQDAAGAVSDNLTSTGVTLSADVPANGGANSALFDGLSVLTTGAYSADLSPATDAYTIMFWVKASKEEQAAGISSILSTKVKAAGGNAAEPAWHVGGVSNASDNDLSMSFAGGGEAADASWQSPESVGAVDQAAVEKGWHHVAFVVANSGHPDFSGDAYSRTYVDGLEVGLESEDTPWTDHSIGNLEGMLMIGASSADGSAGGFSGLLDDVAIFSGVVSEVDIAAIASGAQQANDPLQGAPTPNGMAPLLGTPVVPAGAEGGAVIGCDMQQASGQVTVVWAHTDQGETDLATWAAAAGGGWRDIGDVTAGTTFMEMLTGLDGGTEYAFRFYASNSYGVDWSELGSFTTPAQSRGDTLRIFLMLGQSNMQGQAYTYDSAQTDSWNIPTLEFLLSGSPAATSYLGAMPFGFKDHLDASWLTPRDDVWCVQYDSGTGNAVDVQPTNDPASIFNGLGALSPGYGAATNFGSMIGAELSMGQLLGEATGDPVLLFKSNKGGTTLGNDWRPTEAVSARGGELGVNYTNSMAQVIALLDQLDADLADDGLLNAHHNATKYEISGVFWFQGWNEQYDDGAYTAAELQAEYQDNLVDLIHSIRNADARIPDELKLIVGESSDHDDTLNTGRVGAVAALNAEIVNSAAYFDTDGLKDVSYGNNDEGEPFSSGWGYHFHSRAENFLEIGYRAYSAFDSLGVVTETPALYLGSPSVDAMAFNQVTLKSRIGDDAETVKVVWDSVDRGADLEQWAHSLDLPAWTGGNGNLLATLPGLSEGTSYVVRMYAASSTLEESAWSRAVHFTTPFELLPPTLGEPSATGKTTTTIDLTCEVTRGPVEEAYVVWAQEDQGETDIATWASAAQGGSVALGTASTSDVLTPQMTDLKSGTIYHVRIVASNFRGATWSSVFKVQTARAADEILLTAYYDFEPDGDPYNDPAGVHADDLVGQYNPLLSSDVSAKANGSLQSASFDGNRVLYTDAYSSDLGPDRDAMTIMFWIKGSYANQENTAIRVISTQIRADESIASYPSWLVGGGFGITETYRHHLDMRGINPDSSDYFFAPDAVNGDIAALASLGQEIVWHHVAMVWSNAGDPADGGAYVETYLDGISVGVSSEETSWDGYDIANPDGQLIIGGHKEDAGTRAFTGLLDDVALFAGVVPANKIAAIANGQLKPTDLVAPTVSMSTWLSDFALSGLTGYSDDFDGDGLSNGLEFVLGSQPSEFTAQVMTLVRDSEATRFQHSHNAMLPSDVDFHYEWSSDLITFQKSGETSNGLTVSLLPFRNVPSEGTTSVSVEADGEAENLFFRMVVEPKE